LSVTEQVLITYTSMVGKIPFFKTFLLHHTAKRTCFAEV